MFENEQVFFKYGQFNHDIWHVIKLYNAENKKHGVFGTFMVILDVKR